MMSLNPRAAGRLLGRWPHLDVTGLLVLVISGGLMFQLLDRDYGYILEPDFHLNLIGFYAEAFANLSLSRFPQPSPHPYLDGSHIIYGAFTALVAKLSTFIPAIGRLLPTFPSLALFATELVNAIARTLAAWIFYRSLAALGTGRCVGFVVTLLLTLSPQLLLINLMRVDHLILLPLAAVIHISLLLTLQRARLSHAMILGLAMALLANIKISGGIFGIIPTLAAAAVLVQDRDRGTTVRLMRFSIVAFNVFAVVSVLFLTRFLTLGPRGFLDHFIANVEGQRAWAGVQGTSPAFYYNIDLFMGYGWGFLAIAALSFLIVLIRALATRHPPSVFLAASMLLFSILGIVAFKYSRGGYHLVPIYLAQIGSVGALLRSRVAGMAPRRQRAVTVLLCGLLSLPLVPVTSVYLQEVAAVRYRPEGIYLTRHQPYLWLAEHVAPGSTVCLMRDSAWASVPMSGLELKVHHGPFDFPYLDPEALATYPVPTATQVIEACDILVLNDFHLNSHEVLFDRFGLGPRWQLWQALFDQLAREYSRKVFSSKRPTFGVSRMEIYDLHSDVKRNSEKTH